MWSKARQTSTEDPKANNMSKLLLPFASPSAKMMFDTGDTGAGSYLECRAIMIPIRFEQYSPPYLGEMQSMPETSC